VQLQALCSPIQKALHYLWFSRQFLNTRTSFLWCWHTQNLFLNDHYNSLNDPVCQQAQKRTRLSSWVHLSVTKMECSLVTTQH
jgi:hypothetical protein